MSQEKLCTETRQEQIAAAALEIVNTKGIAALSVSAVAEKTGRIRSDIPPENLAVLFLGIIQPAAVIWSPSEGRFDLRQHTDNGWKLYSRGTLNE